MFIYSSSAVFVLKMRFFCLFHTSNCNLNILQFDEKQGDDQADTTEMFSDEEEEVQVQQLDHIPTHELLQSKEEFPDSEPTDNSVLENDIIFWVRKTIDKLLNYILSLASENWKEI